MADHNTLVGSTTGEIEGGTVLIGGVVREIDSGLVLVNGVAREIVFATLCTVTITGSGSVSRCRLTINGTIYTSAATVEVEPGTIVSCYVRLGQVRGTVKLNGKEVANSGGSSATYNYAVEKNVRISLSYSSYNGNSTISITE